MSVVEEIGKLNKDIRSFEIKLRKPATPMKARQEIKEVIKNLKARRDELCKKL